MSPPGNQRLWRIRRAERLPSPWKCNYSVLVAKLQHWLVIMLQRYAAISQVAFPSRLVISQTYVYISQTSGRNFIAQLKYGQADTTPVWKKGHRVWGPWSHNFRSVWSILQFSWRPRNTKVWVSSGCLGGSLPDWDGAQALRHLEKISILTKDGEHNEWQDGRTRDLC